MSEDEPQLARLRKGEEVTIRGKWKEIFKRMGTSLEYNKWSMPRLVLIRR